MLPVRPATRAAAFVTFMLGCVLPQRRATAQPERSRLSWVRGEGAEACPAVRSVEADVAGRLGYNPFSDEAGRSFEVVATHSGRTWLARIQLYEETRRSSGSREIRTEAEDCGPLVNSVALAIALAIDPNAKLEPDPVVPIPKVEPARAPTTPSHGTAKISLRAVASPNLLPAWAPGAAMGIAVHGSSPWAMSLGASYFPSVRTTSGPASFGFGLTAAWVAPCYVVEIAEGTSSAICAGPEVGALHALVFAPVPTRPGDRLWYALAGSVAARRMLGRRFFLEAGLEGLVPLVRYRFQVQDSPTTVFQQPAVSATGFAGVGFAVD